MEQVSILDPRDIPTRLDEIRALHDNWLEPGSKAPDPSLLSWFEDAFGKHYPGDLELPYLYPTYSGGLRAEWPIGNLDVSLDLEPGSHEAHLHILDSVPKSKDLSTP